jgi:hypothetical protein
MSSAEIEHVKDMYVCDKDMPYTLKALNAHLLDAMNLRCVFLDSCVECRSPADKDAKKLPQGRLGPNNRKIPGQFYSKPETDSDLLYLAVPQQP